MGKNKTTNKKPTDGEFEKSSNSGSTEPSAKTKKELEYILQQSDHPDEFMMLIKRIGGLEGLRRIERLLPLVERAGNKNPERMLDLVEDAMHAIVDGKYQEKIAQLYLQDLIIDNIENKGLSPFTQGQEGEVFKIELNIDGASKNYIVAKRKFHDATSGLQEYKYQLDAHNLLSESIINESVFVPKPIGYFEHDSDEYIVMEFVNGKTLYCLLLERLATDMIKYYEENSSNRDFSDEIMKKYPSNKYKNFVKGRNKSREKSTFSSFWENHYKKSKVFFEHDGEAAQVIMHMIEVIGVFTNYFQRNSEYEGLNPSNQRNQEKILEMLFWKYYAKTDLFNVKESSRIKDNLKVALGKLHANNIYHRDLGQNARNLLFTYGDRIAIIDFGRATNSEDYENIDASGRYDRDEDVLIKISGLVEQPKSESEKHYDEMISRKKLYDSISQEKVNQLLNKIGVKNSIKQPLKIVLKMELPKHFENNRKKSGQREHFFYLKNEEGNYLSKSEQDSALLNEDKFDREVCYLINMFLSMTHDTFIDAKSYIREQVSKYKKSSISKSYALFYKHITDSIDEVLQDT